MMAEFSEIGEVVIQGEGRLRRRLDLGETILGKATLKGPIVTERVDGNTPVQAIPAACWRRGT